MNYIVLALVILLAIYMLYRAKDGTTGSSASYQTINATEARQMIKTSKPTLLDVRTSMEVSSGKIDDALTINVSNPSFKQEVAKLDKSKDYIVYCRSGRRSAMACNIMSAQGFTNLYNLAGGYSSWK